MDKYSPFYWEPRYEADVTKLSEKALEERIIFIGILNNNKRLSDQTKKELEPYYKKYQEEWNKRRRETNNNHN